ncbi:putative receptor-like protein kinase At3g47110 [Daucus carota subsp. sativus]|uniref:putative receptor-like protein kinase At3g47110 n=1 Tax=Daucus carota subsp. sativus TaxID=79200 RepID=UPI0030829D9B
MRAHELSSYLVFLALIISNSSARLSGNERDQQALLAFRAKIFNDPLGVFSSWNMSLHFCSWVGITCSKQHKRVTSINLSSKALVGSLSPDVGNMSFLSEIILYDNHLQGAIPQEVDRLFRLKVLNLGQNAFEGSIPNTLGRLNRLVILKLFSNKLSGVIPTSVFNLSSLNVFNLANNQLQGSIPSGFGSTLPNLQKIQLSDNKFSGSIPMSLYNASKLQTIDLQFNNFSGPISVDCRSLKILELGANNLQGSLSRSIANLSVELTMISLADNQISGSIPPDISKFINLIFLSLEGNNFTGIIPPEITELGKLQRVLLSNNRFSGNIPASIGNLSMLDEIHLQNNDLNGMIPPSFGNCPMLVLLDLSQNNLSGTIPNELFQVTPFSVKLNISRNHLVGSLPAGIGALKTLVELDISENEFAGFIPAELGDCVTLDSLYMQGNFLQGNISQSMKKLRGLRNVDLSRNNLSGKIPDFFENLSLKYLNLSWNHFKGELHTKGVFANASAFSIVGNKGLCGGIPELRLRRCSTHKMSWVQILIMIGSIQVLLVVGCLLWLRRKKTETRAVSIGPASVFLIRLSYELLHQATDGFSRANLVSEGGFGSVYKGELGAQYSENAVAIKVFNEGAANNFNTECGALQNIRHRNIVKIRSTCKSIERSGKEFTAIIYDFMENGSLDRWQYLTCRTSHHELSMPQILNLKNRINIAIDVASALDYLHNQLIDPLIHCNLRQSNILLDAEMSAYVSNFGLAKFLADQWHSDGFTGPSEYAPPVFSWPNQLRSGQIHPQVGIESENLPWDRN